ncbi:hypothetical protein EM595_1643 [Duffyella gerundensis]|uniref:Uncharacterized protein n=1 Tax=Duffyella gerundensis TaxID=1619313 RepID=A0A0U5L4C6_9GAMM|nr:hypothetical protein EM595_1643 [Duffyella gerundensis]
MNVEQTQLMGDGKRRSLHFAAGSEQMGKKA